MEARQQLFFSAQAISTTIFSNKAYASLEIKRMRFLQSTLIKFDDKIRKPQALHGIIEFPFST